MYSKNQLHRSNQNYPTYNYLMNFMQNRKKIQQENKKKEPCINCNSDMPSGRNLTINKNDLNSQLEEKKQKPSSQSSLGSSVINQLASYTKQKNSQNPWIKKYDWDEIFKSSSKEKSITSLKRKVQKQSQEKEKTSKQLHSPVEMRIFQSPNVPPTERTLTIKMQSNKSGSTTTVRISSPIQNSSKKVQSSLKSSQLSSLLNFYRQKKESKQKMSERELLNNQKDKIQKQQKIFISNQQLLDSYLIIQSQKQQKQIKYQGISQPHVLRKRKNYIDDDQFDQMGSYQHLKQIKKIKCSPIKQKNHMFIVNNKKSYGPLRKLRKAKQQDPTCTICLDQIKQRAKLPCKHGFCKDCLDDWLEKTSKCPLCRANADFYLYKGQKFEIEEKSYDLQNYLGNIGGSDDQQQYDDFYEEDYDLENVCQNCDFTDYGDDLIICDRCYVNATHVECDRALNGIQPPQSREWFCSVCRASPQLWYLQKSQEQQ